MPRASTVAAARSTRSSSPSGSTMRRRSARARSMSSYSNMSGVTTVGVREAERAGSAPRCRRAARTSPSAVSYRRCESAARRPRVFMIRTAVSYVPRSVAMIGSDEPSPSIRRSISSGSGNGPFSTMPASDGKVPDALASSVASSTSVRSAGTTTIALSVRRGSTLTIDMPGDDHAEHLAGEQLGVALDEPSFDRAHDAADRRRDEEAGPRAAPRPAPTGRPRRPRATSPGPPRSRRRPRRARRGRRGWRRRRTGRARVRRARRARATAIWPISAGVRGIVEPSCSAAPARPDRRARAARARRGWPRSARCSRARRGCRHPCSRCRRSRRRRTGPRRPCSARRSSRARHPDRARTSS